MSIPPAPQPTIPPLKDLASSWRCSEAFWSERLLPRVRDALLLMQNAGIARCNGNFLLPLCCKGTVLNTCTGNQRPERTVPQPSHACLSCAKCFLHLEQKDSCMPACGNWHIIEVWDILALLSPWLSMCLCHTKWCCMPECMWVRGGWRINFTLIITRLFREMSSKRVHYYSHNHEDSQACGN